MSILLSVDCALARWYLEQIEGGIPTWADGWVDVGVREGVGEVVEEAGRQAGRQAGREGGRCWVSG